MSRIKDSVLAKDKAYAGQSAINDLSFGGQSGLAANIGAVGADGENVGEWISNQAYVKRNIIPVVLKYPKFFDQMGDSKDKLIASYKALIELHPMSIDGLSSGLTVEFDEHAVGGAGEMQEEITNVTRARSTPSFTYKEKAGKAIQKFVDFIIRYGYMDPDTKQPLVAAQLTDEQKKGIYSPDFYTGTVLFIEPDVLQLNAVDAWLCVNMAFKGNGDRTGKRDIHSAGEAPEIILESTAITLNNDVVIKLADTILKSMVVIGFNPNTDTVLPVNKIDTNVKGATTGFDDNSGV
jgi:hypothetical protein